MKTMMHQSPFAILGVTTRDDRKHIVLVAEEKSLELDYDLCQKARSDLTNPRTRLSAEIAWLPGVSPRKTIQLVETLLHNPMAARKDSGLPTLAHLNLLAAAFELVDTEHDAEDLAHFIQQVAYLSDDLDSNDVLRDINEDRAVSGFPEVRTLDQIEAELAERKRHYRNTIKNALDRLPPLVLVQVMTETVNDVTVGGEKHAPELIDELVDSYEVEAQGFLQKEAENVYKLVQAIQDSVDTDEANVKLYVEKLEVVARNWQKIAQPIQVSFKARGSDHNPSRELAWAIRNLAIDLFNKHDMLKLAQRLTVLLQDIFSEIPDVVIRTKEDSEALTDIEKSRNESTAIDPIKHLVKDVLKNIDRSPDTANNEGVRLLSQGLSLLDSAPIDANSSTYREGENMLAVGLMQCAIAYGNETSKWLPCVTLLEKALSLASNADLRNKVVDNLNIARGNQNNFGDLEPIKSAPSLYTINGIGVTLYGNTEHKPDGSYMATYYFVFFFIPLFPIARYRVIHSGRSYRFLGKGKLRTFDKWHIAIFLGLVLLVFLNG